MPHPTNTPARLWVNDNGETICDAHAGMYLAVAIKRAPRRKTHSTPLGTWERFTADDIAALPADERASFRCETCKYER